MSLRILWVRHSPVAAGRVNRDSFLVPRLGGRHEVRVVSWNNRETAGGLLAGLGAGRRVDDGIETWFIPRLPRPPGWPIWWPSVGQPLFRFALKRLERRFSPDIVVVGPSWGQVGLPPPVRALRVFDYLDGSDWSQRRWRQAELSYLDWSDAVLAVSEPLACRVEPWQRPRLLAPNGVDLAASLALRESRNEIRAELGIGNHRLVSLIGLTAAPDPYWMGAIRELVRTHSSVLFAAVGRGTLVPHMERLAAELGPRFRWVGPLSYEQARRWFVASDVTWYPGADIEYFHLASPLKVFEGLAAGTQVVVAPRLRSLRGLDVASLHFVEPTTAALVQGTLDALRAHPVASGLLAERLARHPWDAIAHDVSAFFEELSERREELLAKRR